MAKLKSHRISFVSSCALVASALFLVSCNKTLEVEQDSSKADINNNTKFSSKEYGVAGSPRITTAKRVKKGGGRYQIGKPYKIRNRWYHPKEEPGYNKVGMASWYGPNFHGRLTANGEIYDQYSLSAAHPTMPLPSYAEVTNLSNGAKVVVRVNDRGPYSQGRIIDLSAKASELLGYQKAGIAKVRVRYLGKARMDGLDEKQLLASYQPPGSAIKDSSTFAKAATKTEPTLVSTVEQPKPLLIDEVNSTKRPSAVIPSAPKRRKLEEIATNETFKSDILPTAYISEAQIIRRIDVAFSLVDTKNSE